MATETPRPAQDRWCDAQGTHISLFCWVEQVVEDPADGALFSRLHQRGEVIGRSLDLIYLCLDGEGQVIGVPPQLLRLLPDEPGGCHHAASPRAGDRGRTAMTPESPDLTAAKRLLDTTKRGGFRFQRVAPGPDGPLWGVRETLQWRDTIYLAGFGSACTVTQARKSSLILPGGPLVTQRVDGDALSVLHTVVCDWDP